MKDVWEDRFRLEDESSLLIWYPKIKNLIPTPRTEIQQLSDDEISSLQETLDGKRLPPELENSIIETARKIGYPLFLRSDQGSGKHEWKDTCYVPSEEELLKHVVRLVEWHAEAGFFGIRFNALIYREYIELESSFKAFNQMPIAKERRYFVKDGKVICHHPYWPEDAIHAYGFKLPDNWKERLKILNTEGSSEILYLSNLAEVFSNNNPGYWSVDFAQRSHNFKWYLIDAARGEVSWHDHTCPNCPDEQKPKPFNPDDILVKIAQDDKEQKEEEK